jgi:hypothetical protein
MANYTLTPASPTGAVFVHSGGTLEVIISAESALRSGAEVKIQYETSPGSTVYRTLPQTKLKEPQTALYQLSACNVRAILADGDSGTTADVRLVSVA